MRYFNRCALKFLLLTCCTLLTSSCGKLTGESTGANDVVSKESNLIGGVETLEIAKNRYRFSGVASNAGNSGHNFELKFNLPVSEKVSFFFFANTKLERGFSITFENVAGKIFAHFQLGAKSHRYELATLSGQTQLHFDLDIHNDHTDIHTLLWEHLGAHGDSDECTFEETCLYNTEDFALDFWLGVGRAGGVYWGFEGKSELILEVKGPGSPLSDV